MSIRAVSFYCKKCNITQDRHPNARFCLHCNGRLERGTGLPMDDASILWHFERFLTQYVSTPSHLISIVRYSASELRKRGIIDCELEAMMREILKDVESPNPKEAV